MDVSPNYKNIWPLIIKVFPVLDDLNTLCPSGEEVVLKNEFNQIIDYMKTTPIEETIQDFIVSKIEKRLRDEVVPEFWSYFKKSENDNRGFKQFYNAVKSLYDNYRYLDNVMSKLEMLRQATHLDKSIYNEKSVEDSLKLILKSTLLSQLHVNYQLVTSNFYLTALRMEDVEENNPGGTCIICVQDSFHCNCLHLFQETNRKLGDMTLLEPLVGQTLTNLSYTYIYSHIQKVCKDNFDLSFITSLEKWLQSVVILWLKKIYYLDRSITLNESIETLEKKLINYLYNSYIRVRIDQLFNIIIEFPESLPALQDIRFCLPRTDLKSLLIKKLQKAMETRLLHPGVSTADVLTAYVATIRSLRVLDPSGLLLEMVTQPIHQYLRSREDTVRCVVSSLTEEGPNDLAEELNREEAVLINENVLLDEDSDNWEMWMPDPIDAVANKKTKDTQINPRTADIISMLVSIYGSKELFVNEYRTLLADRLLSQYSCDTEKEIRYLELLKLRFGDMHLHFCEVMLKDVGDSKRINQRIKQDAEYKEENIPLCAMIVSQQFWPPFKDEKLELHEKVIHQMNTFTNAFEALKGSRTLHWKNNLGIVNLEIELNNRTLNLSVSPVHATIIMHFQDKNTWDVEELSKEMRCPPTILRRKIGLWLSHGVLIETEPGVFCVQEEVEERHHTQDDFYVEEYESESAMASAQDQKEEELQNIWSYIMGMLMNLDSLPLERIHHMLKMFAFQGPTTECSQSELKVFLDRKVRERQLIYSNGLYKLPK
ncbi:anaphase-promoting complex subunit 2 [Cylas formicarius]|uniref:anaphase-promoting complex subunit 2 n=1 Tax=Cylas formicarius TaxID=197179 RepID=UPI002958A2A2|nr:anaphase-promoting complex subunit 2 [Cylas formicarius]